MRKTPKKLVLCRETLRLLSAEQIHLALGGDTTLLNCPPPPPTTDTVRVCCAEDRALA